jgi:tRNA-dihydrouridine synthase B
MQFLKNGERLPDPPLAKQYATLLEHYRSILEHYGIATGVKIARKHVAWYSKGLYGSNEFRTRINQMDDPAAVETAIHDFYQPQIDQQASERVVA